MLAESFAFLEGKVFQGDMESLFTVFLCEVVVNFFSLHLNSRDKKEAFLPTIHCSQTPRIPNSTSRTHISHRKALKGLSVQPPPSQGRPRGLASLSLPRGPPHGPRQLPAEQLVQLSPGRNL